MNKRQRQKLAIYRRKNPLGHIYITTNKINGLIYIGQCHYTPKEKSKYLGSGLELKHDIRKYGKENFKKEILEENIKSFKKLEEREIYWTKKFNPDLDPKIGYNRRMGNCSKISKRTLHKMSKSQKKWKRPPFPQHIRERFSREFKGKNGSFYGKKHTKESKSKISKAKIGKKRKPFTKETLKKLSDTKIGAKNPNAKVVKCYVNNRLVKIYPSVSTITRKFGYKKGKILYNIQHKRKIDKYLFEYQ
jgi:group I intron endonuclease